MQKSGCPCAKLWLQNWSTELLNLHISALRAQCQDFCSLRFSTWIAELCSNQFSSTGWNTVKHQLWFWRLYFGGCAETAAPCLEMRAAETLNYRCRIVETTQASYSLWAYLRMMQIYQLGSGVVSPCFVPSASWQLLFYIQDTTPRLDLNHWVTYWLQSTGLSGAFENGRPLWECWTWSFAVIWTHESVEQNTWVSERWGLMTEQTLNINYNLLRTFVS